MEERRIQQAMDFLIGGGYVELRKGQGEAHYLMLTDSGKNLLSHMEGSPA
jgi:predicted transcriptional regulator